MTVEGAGQVIEAELTWTGERFERDIRIGIDSEGLIVHVGSGGRSPDRVFLRRAILPGFVNVHSHAFQRGLRGLGESFPAGAGSFWTWREAMYSLVDRLDPGTLFDLSVQAFREMRLGGITTVGEFHYVHHVDPEAMDWALDQVLIDAARAAGIRLVLLQTFYRTGGIGEPLQGGQRRFRSEDLAGWWEQFDHLAAQLDPQCQSMGVAAHSIRAATPEEIRSLHEESLTRGLPFHIHVEEVVKEVEDTVAAYGSRPLGLLNSLLSTQHNVTAIHCTQADPSDLAAFVGAGGTVCLCPLTEGNLGDGFLDLSATSALDRAMAFGTDSNARIAFPEELRWAEYVQRLRQQRRGVFRGDEATGTSAGDVARSLFTAGTRLGARSLGVPTGEIAVGQWADLMLLDLDAPALAGTTPETLLPAFVFGAGTSAVAGTAVGGEWDKEQ